MDGINLSKNRSEQAVGGVKTARKTGMYIKYMRISSTGCAPLGDAQ